MTKGTGNGSRQMARSIALALPYVDERDQMGSPSFCAKGKIFVQLSPPKAEEEFATIKLPVGEQTKVTSSEPAIFSRVAGYCGSKGWTRVRLAGIEKAGLQELFLASWRRVVLKTTADHDAANVPKRSLNDRGK